MKLTVKRHKYETIRTIDGKVEEQIYSYTVAIKRYGLFWLHLKFNIGRNVHPDDRADRIVNEKIQVPFSAFFFHKHATHFSEVDAIRVKLDILIHPDKYVTRY